MKHAKCPQEEAVERAIRTGEWETSLNGHAAACPICSGIKEASNWMQALARSSEGNLRLPDASLLWRSAQLSEKQASAEGSQSVLEWIAFGSVAVPFLGLTAWLAWNWYAIQGWIAWILAGERMRVTASSVAILFLPMVSVFFLAALLLVYPILVDE